MKNWNSILTIFALLLSACGSNQKDSESSNLSYEYEYNGCKTGKHSFNSTADLCAGLQNHELNNGCAYSLREQSFKNNCSGSFDG